MTSFRPSLRLSLALLAACIGLIVLPARAEVLLPNGEYTTQVEDLRAKVLGGAVVVKRTWSNSRWYLNPAWADLRFAYDALDGSVKAIDRGGASYERSGDGVYLYDKRYFIRAVAGGYQWYDRRGNTIDYDASGRIQGYADRNGVKVGFGYDAAGNKSQVLDHFGNPVLSFAYADGRLSAITDRSGRSVRYQYGGGRLTQVTDVLGNLQIFTYDGNGQLASVTDAEGRTTAIAYVLSIPAPAGLDAGSGSGSAPAPAPGGIASSGPVSAYKVARVGTLTDPLGKTTTYQYEYDRVARLHTVTVLSPAGKKTVGIYNADGRQLSRSIGSRQVAQLDFDLHNVEIATDERGLQTTVQYDASRNPVSTLHPDGSRTGASYDPIYSNPLLRTDEAGVQTRYDYDGRGNLVQLTEAVGLPEQRITLYAYDTYGQPLSRTVKGAAGADDATTRYTYDTYGNLATLTDPLGQTLRDSHDVMGNLIRRSDARGHATDYTWDAAGRLTRIKDPLDQTTQHAYDRAGNRSSTTDPLGHATHYAWDGNNRLIRITDALGGISRFEYDADGNQTAASDPGGVLTAYDWDADGRLSGIRDGNGNATTYEYGSAADGLAGLLAAVNYPTWREEYRYDPRNRPTQTIRVLDPATRHTSSIAWDAVGNAVARTDPLGRSSLNGYDPLRRLIRSTDALAGITEYRYDARDNLLAVTDANGHTTGYTYDLANRLTRETRPLGGTTGYAYDPAGNLTLRSDAQGRQRRYTYDAANRRVKEERYPLIDGAVATVPAQSLLYTWDAAGRLTGYDDGTTRAAYSLDARGNRIGETFHHGPFSTGWSALYGADGRKRSFTYPDGSQVRYTWDAAGHLQTLTFGGGSSIRIDSRQWTAPRQVSLPGATRSHHYDALLRPQRTVLEQGAAGSGLLLDEQRQRWDALNLIERQDAAGSTAYQYDPLDRLIAATPPAAAGLPAEGYTYDGVHNRLGSAHQPGPWIYNANNQLIAHGSGAAQTTLDYDANGHLVKQTRNGIERRYRYDLAERLVGITDAADQPIAAYAYDPFGRRIRKTAHGQTTYYQYAEEGLIAEYDAAGTPQVFYGWQPHGSWGGGAVFQSRPASPGQPTWYYLNDHLGTPQAMTDAAGQVVWRAKAEAFGKTTVTAESTASNNLRFPGQYFDEETGMHYNWHRDYDPEVGRYVQSDPIGLSGGINPYTYVEGNPMKYADSTGLVPDGKPQQTCFTCDWDMLSECIAADIRCGVECKACFNKKNPVKSATCDRCLKCPENNACYRKACKAVPGPCPTPPSLPSCMP